MENILQEVFTKNESIISKIIEALISLATSDKTMENQLGQIHKLYFKGILLLYIVNLKRQVPRIRIRRRKSMQLGSEVLRK